MNSPIIKPTIGRVVWFHPSEFTGEAGFARHGNDQPYAAIIAHVWGDAMVNLTVFDAKGAAHSRTSVALVQDGSPVPGGGFYCEWMPYQKNQAAKAEAAQATEPVGHPILTQRDQLEYVLVSGAAGRLAEAPHEAAGIAAGIKNVLNALRPTNVKIDATTITLPVIDPGPDSLERTHADTHASAVLYPAIKRAMEELETLHPGFNFAVNRAFNHLHDAFWSECPAPASAAPKRPDNHIA